MIEFEADYYDGKSSARKKVRVRSYPGVLTIDGQDVRLEIPFDQIEVDAPVGGGRRAITLPQGAQLQTEDHAAVDELFPRAHRLERAIYALERSWAYALGGLVLLGLITWWTVADGLPRAAKIAAGLVPLQLELELGEQAVRGIDGGLCKTSTLDEATQRRLRTAFAGLTAGLNDGYRYRLELRDCPRAGPNAFALPGGPIVLTDALVTLADTDAQIVAVLAHEAGHVRHRHGLRIALQAAGVGALFAALCGDARSVSGVVVAIPTLLLEKGYSRAFEEEADDYAFGRLKELGLSPASFAEILSRLEQRRGGAAWVGYLSTHPATDRRAARALEADRR